MIGGHASPFPLPSRLPSHRQWRPPYPSPTRHPPASTWDFLPSHASVALSSFPLVHGFALTGQPPFGRVLCPPTKRATGQRAPIVRFLGSADSHLGRRRARCPCLCRSLLPPWPAHKVFDAWPLSWSACRSRRHREVVVGGRPLVSASAPSVVIPRPLCPPMSFASTYHWTSLGCASAAQVTIMSLACATMRPFASDVTMRATSLISVATVASLHRPLRLQLGSGWGCAWVCIHLHPSRNRRPSSPLLPYNSTPNLFDLARSLPCTLLPRKPQSSSGPPRVVRSNTPH